MGEPAADFGVVERVLVVEDDDVNRIMMVRMLQMDGYVVDAVDRAEKAVLLPMESYDVIVCDFRLPGADGKALARVVDGAFGPDAPPVVFVTACATVEALAPNKVVTKPFSRKELLEAVRFARCRRQTMMAAR